MGRALIVADERVDEVAHKTTTTTTQPEAMSANLAMYTSLSLLGLCALAGAGVGVGSGVAMMTMQMMDAEEQAKTVSKPTAAASPIEKARGMSFASSALNGTRK